MARGRRLVVTAGAALGTGWLGLRRGIGLTAEERGRSMAGDDVIESPSMQLTHAVSIGAPPDRVWPWLVQMGYGRGGWYTPPWIDRLWGVENPSADSIVPSLQTLAVGDTVLDGPPGTATFTVRHLDPDRSLVLHSRRHPLHGRPPRPGFNDPFLEFTWEFAVVPDAALGSRLLVRTRGRATPRWLDAVARLVFPFADAYLGVSMLRGIKARVEAS